MNKKFLQPADAVEIVTPGNGLVLTDEVIEIGRSRVASGEPIDEVALDLAILDESLAHPFGDPEDEDA